MSYLGNGAFYGTYSIDNFSHQGVLSYFFIQGCTNLATLTIPASVSYLGNGVFKGGRPKLIVNMLILRVSLSRLKCVKFFV